MVAIAEAINIGPTLASDLGRAGLDTLEHLRAHGYREAWRRVHDVNPDRDCSHSMLALAGAIEGVRWTTLPEATRE